MLAQRGDPLPWLSPRAYVVCGGIGAAVVPVLVAWAVGLLGAVAVGCGAVMGVTVMPTTAPLTVFLCLDPMVFHAARVALRFAAAAVFASTVSGVRAFGCTPKSARMSGWLT